MVDKDIKKVTPAEFGMALVVTLTLITVEMQLVTMFTISGELILFIVSAIGIVASISYAIYRIICNK